MPTYIVSGQSEPAKSRDRVKHGTEVKVINMAMNSNSTIAVNRSVSNVATNIINIASITLGVRAAPISKVTGRWQGKGHINCGARAAHVEATH